NDLEPPGRGDERDTVLRGWPDPGELPRRAAVCRAEYERSPAGGIPRGHQRGRTKGADLPGLKRRGAGLRPGTGWVRQPRRCAPGLAGVGGAVDSRRALRVERVDKAVTPIREREVQLASRPRDHWERAAPTTCRRRSCARR